MAEFLPWRGLVCSLVLHALLIFVWSPWPAASHGVSRERIDVRLVAASRTSSESVPVEALSSELEPLPELFSDAPPPDSDPLKASETASGIASAEANVLPQPSDAEASTRYLPTRRLDARPVVSEDDPGLLPRAAPSSSPVRRGGAILVLWVNETGGVDRVEVKSSSLPDEVTAGFVDNFKRVRFRPATSEGLPSGFFMRVRVRVEQPDELDAESALSQPVSSGEFPR